MGPSSEQNSILGFSNSGLNVPYKKVEIGKERFKNIVSDAKVSTQTELIEDLLTFLKSKEKYTSFKQL